MQRTVLALLFSVLTAPGVFVAQAAPSGAAESQNAAAKKALIEFGSKFSCPEDTQAKAERVIRKKNLPVLLKEANPMVKEDYADFIRQMSEAKDKLHEYPGYTNGAGKEAIDKAFKQIMTDTAEYAGLTPAELKEQHDRASIPKRLFPEGLSRPRAEMSFDNKVQTYCNAECEMDIKWSFIQSIGLWKAFCVQCTDDFMSVITDGQNHWVDWRALAWLSRTNHQPTDFSGFPGESGRLASAITQQRVNPLGLSREDFDLLGKGYVFYELVDKHSQAQQELCKLRPSSQKEPRLLNHLRSVFCGAGSAVPDSDVAKLQIVLAKEEQSGDLLACAGNNNFVKIHFDQARFQFPDMFGKSSVVVGPVASPIHSGMAVVLHEVGHWFGLPHLVPAGKTTTKLIKKYELADIPDVMMPRYSENMCGSALTFTLMRNMSDPEIYDDHFVDGGCLLAK